MVPAILAAALMLPAASTQSADVSVTELSSVRRLVDALGRTPSKQFDAGDVVALIDAVTGQPMNDGRVRATAALLTRDALAYRLLAIGYSAHETADIVAGRISKTALDTAARMIMAGRSREAASDYLDRQRTTLPARTNAPPVADRFAAWDSLPARIDAAIDRAVARYGVSRNIVRAVISAESAFDPHARSPRGAIGLMQLMPSTARDLGVEPDDIEQNVDGGVRYLSSLLTMFGGLELALVAYNGGPAYAERYAQGKTALYGETRAYVNQVLKHLRR